MLIDSGASSHIFREQDVKVDKWIHRRPGSVTGAGSILPSRGVGLVHGMAGLIVPNLSQPGLISVAQLIDTSNLNGGGQVLFTKHGWILGQFTTDVIQVQGNRVGDLYYGRPMDFAGGHTTETSNTCMPLTQDAKPANFAIVWHMRFGHMSYKRLKEIRDKKMLKVVTFTDAELEEAQMQICSGCAAGGCMKKPRYSKSRGPSPTPTRNCEQVAMDIIDNSTTPGRNGEKYGLVIVCKFTKRVWVYLLPDKSQSPIAAIKQWRDDVSRDPACPASGELTITLRTDNEGCFGSDGFIEYCRLSWIKLQFSTPIEGHANSAEVNIRILRQMTRCMLLRCSHLSLRFWGDALVAAAYIRNRTPVAAIDNMQPLAKWLNKPINITHLKVWGSPCVVHITRKNRGRGSGLAPTSQNGVIVGYCPEYPGRYNVFLKSSKVVVARVSIYANESLTMGQALVLPQLGNGGERSNGQHTDQLWNGSKGQLTDPLHTPDTADTKHNDPMVGKTVSKRFSSGVFRGRVTKKDVEGDTGEPMYTVMYEDGDSEDLYLSQLKKVLDPKDCNIALGASPSPRVVSHKCRDVLDDHDHEEDSAHYIAWSALQYVSSGFTCSMSANSLMHATGESCYHIGAHAVKVTDETFADDIPVPKSMKAALAGPHKEHWEKAMKREHNSLLDNNVYVTIPIKDVPAGKRIIRAKHVLKVKSDENGHVAKFKVRVVLLGFLAIWGVDYLDTFAPAARAVTIRLVLCVAAILDLDLRQMDVTTAFLGAPLEIPTYVHPPHGLGGIPNGHVLLLKRALYGHPASPRAFWMEMQNHLRKMGFTRSHIDPCLYHRITKEHYSLIALVVDDLLIATNSPKGSILVELSKRFDMKDLGSPRYCLGMGVTRNRKERSIELSQLAYTERIVRAFKMATEIKKKVRTPGSKSKRMSVVDKVDYQDKKAPFPYKALVGSLLYAACGTRPDIAFSVGVAARFSQSPGIPHWEGARRILRYLKETCGKTLKLGGTSVTLYAMGDASWAGNNATPHDDHASTTGTVCIVGSFGPIYWMSKKQRTVALSSCNSEFVASAETIYGVDEVHKSVVEIVGRCATMCSAIGIRTMLGEIGFPQGQTFLLSDNESSIAAIKNPQTKGLRHVHLRYHRIRQSIESLEFKMMKINTRHMIANVLTKNPSIADFEREREIVLGHADKEDLPQELVLALQVQSEVPMPEVTGATTTHSRSYLKRKETILGESLAATFQTKPATYVLFDALNKDIDPTFDGAPTLRNNVPRSSSDVPGYCLVYANQLISSLQNEQNVHLRFAFKLEIVNNLQVGIKEHTRLIDIAALALEIFERTVEIFERTDFQTDSGATSYCEETQSLFSFSLVGGCEDVEFASRGPSYLGRNKAEQTRS